MLYTYVFPGTGSAPVDRRLVFIILTELLEFCEISGEIGTKLGNFECLDHTGSIAGVATDLTQYVKTVTDFDGIILT
jgi:hypothetical protein